MAASGISNGAGMTTWARDSRSRTAITDGASTHRHARFVPAVLCGMCLLLAGQAGATASEMAGLTVSHSALEPCAGSVRGDRTEVPLVLVWWLDSSTPADPEWVQLHGLEGSLIGLLPDASPLLADPAARLLGLYDSAAPYFLISRGSLALLQAGDLPTAWEGLLARFENETAEGTSLQPGAAASSTRPSPARPSSAELLAIEPLAQDAAQALVLLPASLAWIAEEPGCRAQRLPAPRIPAAGDVHEATGEAGASEETRLPGLPPDASSLPPLQQDRQGAEYWQALAQAVSGDRLFAHADYLATTLQTRHSYTNQMNLACEYVRDEFAALGLETSFDNFTYAGRSLKNVVGIKQGTVTPSRIYIIGGHLDSTSPSPSTLAPGAEDNASGSIAVLEAARLLAPLPTDYTIHFICFSAEEQGLIGSEHYATLADQQNLDICGVLILDMAAYYSPAGADLWLEGFRYGTSSVWLLDLVQANAQAYTDLAIYRYSGEGWGSDHEPFHDHGFPAILSIEDDWDSYPCYHRTCDTVSYLNESLWRRIIAANVISLGQLAQVQGGTGKVYGTVLAPFGDPGGATLCLIDTEYPQLTSDSDGEFIWPELFPGTYTLIAEKPECEPDTLQVVVESGNTLSVVVTLLPEGWSGVDDESDSSISGRSIALSVAPNPAVSGATILLDLPRPQSGSLWVYGPDGRRVAMLHRAGALSGTSRFEWNGRDALGHEVPAGIYWVRWRGDAGSAKRAVAVVR